jgi:uncharacterized protein YneF (UPF0154 family)
MAFFIGIGVFALAVAVSGYFIEIRPMEKTKKMNSPKATA